MLGGQAAGNFKIIQSNRVLGGVRTPSALQVLLLLLAEQSNSEVKSHQTDESTAAPLTINAILSRHRHSTQPRPGCCYLRELSRGLRY